MRQTPGRSHLGRFRIAQFIRPQPFPLQACLPADGEAAAASAFADATVAAVRCPSRARSRLVAAAVQLLASSRSCLRCCWDLEVRAQATHSLANSRYSSAREIIVPPPYFTVT